MLLLFLSTDVQQDLSEMSVCRHARETPAALIMSRRRSDLQMCASSSAGKVRTPPVCWAFQAIAAYDCAVLNTFNNSSIWIFARWASLYQYRQRRRTSSFGSTYFSPDRDSTMSL